MHASRRTHAPGDCGGLQEGGYSESLRFIDWQNDGPRVTPIPFTFDTLHNEEEIAEIWLRIAERIKQEVKDPVLAEKLTPDYSLLQAALHRRLLHHL